MMNVMYLRIYGTESPTLLGEALSFVPGRMKMEIADMLVVDRKKVWDI